MMAQRPRRTAEASTADNRFRRATNRWLGLGVLLAAGLCQPASALSFDFFGIEGEWTLSGRYAYQVRAEEVSQGVINTPGREQIPIPEYLKWPNSFNFDDGDRTYDQWDPVFNRVVLTTSLQLKFTDNFGFSLSADAFYDHVYHTASGYEKPDFIQFNKVYDKNGGLNRYGSRNTVGHPANEFTDVAKETLGADFRLKNAYFHGTFFFGGTSMNIKVGQMVTAWGQSTFFSGVARALAPADAVRARVPGTGPSDIFIPTLQATIRWRLNRKVTLVFNQKFEWKPNQLAPAGTYYSVSDIISPGADFAYAIKNPLNPATLKDLKLNAATGRLLDNVLQAALGISTGGLLESLLSTCGGVAGPLCNVLEDVVIDEVAVPLLRSLEQNGLASFPAGFPVIRKEDIRPDQYNMGQWGFGIEYSLSFSTEIAYYHLNYHSHVPLPHQYLSPDAVVAKGPSGNPIITTGTLGLQVPTTYRRVYFQDVKMDAIAFSTVLGGWSVAGEFIYRRGAPTLAKDPGNALSGPIPTPARSENFQILVNAVKTFGPTAFWDSLIVVGAASYIRLMGIQPQRTQVDLDGDGDFGEQKFDELIDLFDKEAAAIASRMIFTYDGVFPGWDLKVPVNIRAAVWNRTPMPGAFASLFSQGDYRIGIGATFTNTSQFTIGFGYQAYLGEADDDKRPLQDRDTLGLFVSYTFF